MTTMRLLGLITLIALVSWSIFWWSTSNKIENAIHSWFDQQVVGQDREYQKISSAGFPNRIDLTIENSRLTNYKHELSISTKLIQILTLIYVQDFFISIVKPPIYINYKNKHFIIEGDSIRSSVNFDINSKPSKIVIEAPNLKLSDTNEYVWEFTDLLFANERNPDTIKPQYKYHLRVDNIKLPPNYLKLENYIELIDPVIKKISLNSNISFTQNFYNLPSLDKISTIDDLTIEIDWGVIRSSVKGNLSLSKDKLLNGSFEIKILNWQELLLFVHKEKLLNEKLFKTVKSGLVFIASQTIDGNQLLTVPLNFKNSFIFLGPIKIGKINSDLFM